MNLENLLGGKDNFYIMHLSYGGEEKDRLWKYAQRNSIIGLSHHQVVTDHWMKLRKKVKNELSNVWIKQFDMFCDTFGDGIKRGDIVVILEGWYYLLGIAKVSDNQPRYIQDFILTDEFFDHVREVEWLVKYDYDKRQRLQMPISGFNRTLAKVREGTVWWDALITLELSRWNRLPKNEKSKRIEKENRREVKEGEQYRTEVKFRKRHRGLIEEKKENSDYRCEVCEMKFEEVYGDIGRDYIIAHHKEPIGSRKKASNTTLDDIALVCANCHAMLHRRERLMSISELRRRIRKK